MNYNNGKPKSHLVQHPWTMTPLSVGLFFAAGPTSSELYLPALYKVALIKLKVKLVNEATMLKQILP